jgi:hypothetical protein
VTTGEASVRQGRGGRLAALRTAPAMLTALVALASSAVALAFTLWPRLAPDPGTTYRAHVSVFAVERGVSAEQYVRRSAFSAPHRRQLRAELLKLLGASGADAGPLLRVPGEMAYVASQVEGFKHGSVELRWSLYDAGTLRRVRIPGFGDVAAARLDLDAPTDRTMQTLWIPPVPAGPYRLRVALYDTHETLLDVADSSPFRGLLP